MVFLMCCLQRWSHKFSIGRIIMRLPPQAHMPIEGWILVGLKASSKVGVVASSSLWCTCMWRVNHSNYSHNQQDTIFDGSNSPTRQRMYRGLWLLRETSIWPQNTVLHIKEVTGHETCWNFPGQDTASGRNGVLAWNSSPLSCIDVHWHVNFHGNLGRYVAFDLQLASVAAKHHDFAWQKSFLWFLVRSTRSHIKSPSGKHKFDGGGEGSRCPIIFSEPMSYTTAWWSFSVI